MKILLEVLAELVGMFVGDAPLSAAILALVAGTAAAIDLLGVDPLLGGCALLAGCLLLLVESVRRSSRNPRTG
jgi:Mn2+/Fe2+ NRAMP family transporter